MLTDVLDNVSSLVESGLIEDFSRGDDVLVKLKKELEATIEQNSPTVRDAIANAGTTLRGIAKDITDALDKFAQLINQNSFENYKTADKYIEEYSKYRFWASLGVASILLVIVICLIFGLLCGICGRRPSGYGDDCCNKGSGGNFLML